MSPDKVDELEKIVLSLQTEFKEIKQSLNNEIEENKSKHVDLRFDLIF